MVSGQPTEVSDDELSPQRQILEVAGRHLYQLAQQEADALGIEEPRAGQV